MHTTSYFSPCTSVAYNVLCSFDNSFSKIKLYRDKDCIEWFINELKCLAEKVDEYLKIIVPMEFLTTQQKKEFKFAKISYIFKNPFRIDDIEHRDHCHFIGKYHCGAHQGCNINYKDSHVIPVVFHNLSGYDSHFFIKV